MRRSELPWSSDVMNPLSRTRRNWMPALTAAPIALYLLVLVAVALFARPPLLGWIGLGLVATVAVSVWALAVYLWQRSRVNTDRLHPHRSETFRLLVVLDADAEPEELAQAVALRTGSRRAEVHVVAPAAGSVAHLWAGDSDDDAAAANALLSRTLLRLNDPRQQVEGSVGAPDPLEATGDELTRFPADEILFVGRRPERRAMLDRGFERRARDLFGVRCSTLYDRQPARRRTT